MVELKKGYRTNAAGRQISLSSENRNNKPLSSLTGDDRASYLAAKDYVKAIQNETIEYQYYALMNKIEYHEKSGTHHDPIARHVFQKRLYRLRKYKFNPTIRQQIIGVCKGYIPRSTRESIKRAEQMQECLVAMEETIRKGDAMLARKIGAGEISLDSI